MTGVLKNGFLYEVRDDYADDYDLLELISEVEDNPLAVPKLVNKLLGAEQAKALKAHLARDGITKISDMENAVSEIFANHAPLKNS